MGVETTFYDPRIGAGIEALFRPNTKAVLTESPGSQSFEIQDVPAIAEVAHARGACVLMDNTWATPLFFPPHAHGVDMAIEAGTKYLSGHSDLLLGLVSANADWIRARCNTRRARWRSRPGRRTSFWRCAACARWNLRLREAERQGLAMARWLGERPEVLRVLHPALPDDPGHAIWKRDFSGSSGLFSVILKPVSEAAVAAFLDGLELFGLGYSWGGYESLVIPFDCSSYRTATHGRPAARRCASAIGLEDAEDLKADLDRGFRAVEGDRLSDVRDFLIDTDTASDDAVAIIMALAAPDVRVLGLTTVAGNVALEQATRNALCHRGGLRLGRARLSRAPVRRSSRALRDAHWFHGADGLGDHGYPPPQRAPEGEHAVDAILRPLAGPSRADAGHARAADQHRARARRDPALAERVGRCVVMGGAPCCEGNVTPAAEYNIWVDPEAARAVFRSPPADRDGRLARLARGLGAERRRGCGDRGARHGEGALRRRIEQPRPRGLSASRPARSACRSPTRPRWRSRSTARSA